MLLFLLFFYLLLFFFFFCGTLGELCERQRTSDAFVCLIARLCCAIHLSFFLSFFFSFFFEKKTVLSLCGARVSGAALWRSRAALCRTLSSSSAERPFLLPLLFLFFHCLFFFLLSDIDAGDSSFFSLSLSSLLLVLFLAVVSSLYSLCFDVFIFFLFSIYFPVRQMLLPFVCLFSLVCAVAPSVTNGIWTETGDAGDLPASAQYIPVEYLVRILGNISSSTDVDLFRFNIRYPTLFSATSILVQLSDPMMVKKKKKKKKKRLVLSDRLTKIFRRDFIELMALALPSTTTALVFTPGSLPAIPCTLFSLLEITCSQSLRFPAVRPLPAERPWSSPPLHLASWLRGQILGLRLVPIASI